MKNWFKKHALIILIGLYALLAIFASMQSIALGEKTYVEGGKSYNRYNNYSIFAYSFEHLVDDKDLYKLYPKEHWDLYKYSPAFALGFGLFAVFPDVIGLNLWNGLNALILIFAFIAMPGISNRKTVWLALFCIPELVTSMQNEQSNGLMAGLFIWAFLFLERKHFFWAVLMLVLSIYIKLFGIVLFALFLMYPKKEKVAVFTATQMLGLTAIPLLAVNLEQLSFLYESWLNLLANDHSSSIGYSVMGWLQSWFSMEPNKNFILLLGVVIFSIPLLRWKQYTSVTFRLLLLASAMIWVVIFNHKAESPTFIIAVAGVGLWYFQKTSPSYLDTGLMIATIFFTSLAPTDIYPFTWRKNFFEPFVIKAIPCILVWVKIIYEMVSTQFILPEMMKTEKGAH